MYDGLSVDALRDMLKGEAEVFNANVEGLYQLIDETEDEIAQLEREKQALIEARDGLSIRKSASLFDQTAAIAQSYLNKWREATAHNSAIAEAAAAKQTLMGRDGAPLKPMKVPELKLLHKLTIQLKPAPLAPCGVLAGAPPSSSPPEVSPTTEKEKKSGGFFGALKAKLKLDDDKPSSPSPPQGASNEDQEAQALCRFGMAINHCPGHRFVDIRSTEAVEVASVKFALRVVEGPNALTHKDSGDLAAFIHKTIHNALSATANAAHESGLEAELRESTVAKRHEEIQSAIAAAQEKRAAAQRVLDSMIVEVNASPVTAAAPGAAPCFHCTVTIKQRPDPDFFATVEKIVASEEYRQHQAKAEKAYAILETFALHDFSAAIDVGVAARPPPMMNDADRRALAATRRAIAVERTTRLWREHRKLLTDEAKVATVATSAVAEQEAELREGGKLPRSAAATEKLAQLVDAARPALLALIDGFIHPGVHRTVCPSTADPNPLERAPVAANLYLAQVFRAPREMVKIAVNEMYDKAAAKAEALGEANRAAAVRLAAAKTKVSAALGLYDDLFFEVVPFPSKSANQKKRAAVLLKRAETNTAAAVNYLSERALAALREVMNERQAVIDAEAQEGKAKSALRDAASALAAVARAISKLTDTPDEPAKGTAGASKQGRYDVTLCACEGAAPLVLSLVVKPPPSMLANVESSRVSWVLALQPAPASAAVFTGRQAGRACRCSAFNAPLQLLVGDVAVKVCDLAEEHSPLRRPAAADDDDEV